MDAKLINPVLETTINVLTTMAHVKPNMGKPSLKSDEIALGEVTGYMTMESPKVRASLAITFSKQSILDLAKRMLGEELTEVNDMAKDLAGEMTNMVVGGVKTMYLKLGYNFNMTTPSVLYGAKHTVHHEYGGKTIVLPFDAEGKKFYIELSFSE